ncbi:MAG: hypothetical protein ABR604_03515 [Jatrophihabitantaceae bacterium]
MSNPPPGYGQDPRQGQQPGYGQQSRQQPGYGQQPAYGQPPMGPITSRMSRIDPGPSQAFGLVGAIIAALGAILVVVAFTAVDWFKTRNSAHSHFSDIHRVLGRESAFAATPAKLYFAWLGWVLLIVVVLVALLANLPSPAAPALRGLGVLFALAAIALTFLAVNLVKSGLHGPAYTTYLKDARLGFYLAVGGFLLAGIGAAIGPKRSRR